MLHFLFPALTAAPKRGEALFAAVSAKARERHWYIEGAVPDTLDGRFRMLATLTALLIVRLERPGDDGEVLSVAFTERFIEVMESEHRELGLGDPKLGRTVRKLVGSLARRVDLWRSATTNPAEWGMVTKNSIYKGETRPGAIEHSAERLRSFWSGLQGTSSSALATGRF